jgi:hypothetical protein
MVLVYWYLLFNRCLILQCILSGLVGIQIATIKAETCSRGDIDLDCFIVVLQRIPVENFI